MMMQKNGEHSNRPQEYYLGNINYADRFYKKYAISAGFITILLVVLALLFRMIGVTLSFIKTKLNKKERLFCAIAYTPKATVQAAIGTIPLSMGISCGDMVLTVAVISILLTAPFGAICIDNLNKKLLHE